MELIKLSYRNSIIAVLIFVIGFFMVPPIPQSQAYHNFVDGRLTLNIPNFADVVSNIPFLFVGIFGLLKLKTISKSKRQYFIFFIGIIGVSIGSSYYHLNPTNSTLVWDRLPMTVVFMSLASIIISEFVDSKKGQLLLFPMIITGIVSIFYWVIFNDLKWYALVQFFPMVLLPIILVFCKSKYTMTFGYWFLLIAYVAAKVFEYYDTQIFDTLRLVSGHSLKHIVSASGLAILLYTYLKRELVDLK